MALQFSSQVVPTKGGNIQYSSFLNLIVENKKVLRKTYVALLECEQMVTNIYICFYNSFEQASRVS